MSSLLLYCRPGFEAECASEILELPARVPGETRYDPRCGYVLFMPTDADTAVQLHAQLAFTQLVFTRQWFVVCEFLKDLPRGDRIAPLLASAHKLGRQFCDVFIETPDSDASKPLLPLCRALRTPLEQGLKQAKLLGKTTASSPRLHVCFFTTDYAALGYAHTSNSSPWPMGIPRLRRLHDAPSRSAQKLEEALRVLLNEEERQRYLQAGMQAVDLGAAPGGWSWIMARQGIHVDAVDNGQLAASAIATGFIEHIRADGFRYRPVKTVDWLLCDMVEQPSRIAELIGQWFVRGLCRHAIFNLKLPMKKRFQEYKLCLKTLRGMLAQTGREYEIRGRQLYHDRDEITLCITTRSP
ncbi:MAG: 23S rRNA (cytidine(2498)-2'-O)-methyltransferase RlmM [Gammaproteobacteria bacterium]|nr:23S rRNA (cytidine(2498)-2'-O)-methyltransferase RlmM [Gammaproteobacteria bacterium]